MLHAIKINVISISKLENITFDSVESLFPGLVMTEFFQIVLLQAIVQLTVVQLPG